MDFHSCTFRVEIIFLLFPTNDTLKTACKDFCHFADFFSSFKLPVKRRAQQTPLWYHVQTEDLKRKQQSFKTDEKLFHDKTHQ